MAPGANRVELDVNGAGNALWFDYDGWIDSATLGPVTNATVNARMLKPSVWILLPDVAVNDSVNSLVVSGGLVSDKTYTNIKVTSGGQVGVWVFVRELTGQSRALPFGVTGSSDIDVELTGINVAGTLSGRGFCSVPARPYSLPGVPGITLFGDEANGFELYFFGAQNDSTADGYTELFHYNILVDGVETEWLTLDPDFQIGASFPAEPNHTYQVKCYFSNSSGNSGFNFSDLMHTTPAPPSDMAASRSTSSATTVTVSWVRTAPHAKGFVIERSNGTSWSQLGTAGPSQTTYVDSAATLGTAWQYRIRTTSTNPVSGELIYSAYSDVVTVNQGYSKPPAPTIALTNLTTNIVLLTIKGFTNVSTSPTCVTKVVGNVSRLADSVVVDSFENNSPSGTDTSEFMSGLAQDTRYQAFAQVSNPQFDSNPTTALFSTMPRVPELLSAGRNAEALSVVTLTWDTAPSSADEVEVYVQPSGGTRVLLTTVLFQDGQAVVSQNTSSTVTYTIRYVATARGRVNSITSNAITVGSVLVTDKSKIPGVDAFFVGNSPVQEVTLGSNSVWVNGDL